MGRGRTRLLRSRGEKSEIWIGEMRGVHKGLESRKYRKDVEDLIHKVGRDKFDCCDAGSRFPSSMNHMSRHLPPRRRSLAFVEVDLIY
jgi:hypothetical protein